MELTIWLTPHSGLRFTVTAARETRENGTAAMHRTSGSDMNFNKTLWSCNLLSEGIVVGKRVHNGTLWVLGRMNIITILAAALFFFLFCVFCFCFFNFFISCQKPLWPHIRGADLIPFSFLAVGFFLLRVTFCLMTADIKKKGEKKVSECRKVSNIKFFSVWVKVRYDVEALRGTFQCGACGSSRCRVWWWQLMG